MTQTDLTHISFNFRCHLNWQGALLRTKTGRSHDMSLPRLMWSTLGKRTGGWLVRSPSSHLNSRPSSKLVSGWVSFLPLFSIYWIAAYFFFNIKGHSMPRGGGGGGGGSLPLEAIPDAREKINIDKGYPNQGWARTARIAKRVSKLRKMGEKGIQIAMIRVQALGLYVERVGNLRQHVRVH